MTSQAKEAAALIKSKINDLHPKIGIVLGSGLGPLADEIENPITIPYRGFLPVRLPAMVAC